MLQSETINQIPVDNPLVYAFRINGKINAVDLKAMGAAMNDAFDAHPSVSMLLIFEQVRRAGCGRGL